MSTTISRSTDSAVVVVEKVLGPFSIADSPRTIMHPILGSTAQDVTLRPAVAGTGTMTLCFPTHGEAETARQFHRAAATFSTSSDDELAEILPAFYVPQSQVGLAQYRDDLDTWTLDVQFQELVAP